MENLCSVDLNIDSETGVVKIKTRGEILKGEPFKAVNIITAIAKGFSPERAFNLMDDDNIIEVIDLREYVGKSKSALNRIKGRVIGLNGKSRRLIEELSGGNISIYGHSVSIIGTLDEVKAAGEAVKMLARGSAHRTVYSKLQKNRSKIKLDRLMLWEDSNIG